MSLQKFSEIRRGGTYTPQRSMLEHLCFLEEIILREEPERIDIPTIRIRLAQQLKEYKEQNKINNPFDIESIQSYFLATAERELHWRNLHWRKSQIRGMYTSALIQQAEGDEPITIDMLGKNINYLLCTINTPRHITINNTKGDNTGADAGTNHGQANLTINNTEGGNTGAFAGSGHGKAYLTINNTKGDYTGMLAGSYNGTAHLTITNTEGYRTGTQVGFNGNAIIVAYNNQGSEPFTHCKGTIVNYNPNKTPIIEGVTREHRTQILHLIAQNASPEDIMAYLVKK